MATVHSAAAPSVSDAITNPALQQRKKAAVPRGIGIMTQIFAARAENAELWDVEDYCYIDFGGGIVVLNMGHRHPKVIAAVEAQLAKLTHTMFQITPYDLYVSLAEKLNRITPGTHSKKTAFFSTGAEAIGNTIKIACVAIGRSGIIAFSDAFHGRSMMAMSLTGGLGGTYAGNPPAIAAAHAVIDIICEENLLERGNVLGPRLTQRLELLRAKLPQIANVGGLGAMIAIEFDKPGTHEPDPDFTKRVQTCALDRGLILLICGVNANALRFLFPLTTSDSVFDEALEILGEVLLEGAKQALAA